MGRSGLGRGLQGQKEQLWGELSVALPASGCEFLASSKGARDPGLSPLALPCGAGPCDFDVPGVIYTWKGKCFLVICKLKGYCSPLVH